MAQHQSIPSHSPTIDRPECLVCGTLMWLAYVEADGPTRDKRTFECPVCETHEIAFVEFKQAAQKPPRSPPSLDKQKPDQCERVVSAPTNLLIRSIYKEEQKRKNLKRLRVVLARTTDGPECQRIVNLIEEEEAKRCDQ
jgi:hypothetical protein